MTRMRRRAGDARDSIDWQATRERLARAHAATEAVLALPPERARAVMDERARALAQRPVETAPPGEVLEILSFTLGRERYAIETRFVREVARSGDVTPVPGAPAFVMGITHMRGDVLAIIDLPRLFGVAGGGITDRACTIVLGAGASELGMLADAVHAVDALPAKQVLAPPESIAGIGRASLRGVTRNALIVIDGDMLLSDARLVVEQEGPDGHPGAPRHERGMQ